MFQISKVKHVKRVFVAENEKLRHQLPGMLLEFCYFRKFQCPTKLHETEKRADHSCIVIFEIKIVYLNLYC